MYTRWHELRPAHVAPNAFDPRKNAFDRPTDERPPLRWLFFSRPPSLQRIHALHPGLQKKGREGGREREKKQKDLLSSTHDLLARTRILFENLIAVPLYERPPALQANPSDIHFVPCSALALRATLSLSLLLSFFLVLFFSLGAGAYLSNFSSLHTHSLSLSGLNSFSGAYTCFLNERIYIHGAV